MLILLVVVTIIFVAVVVPLLVNFAGKHDTKDIPGKSYVPT